MDATWVTNHLIRLTTSSNLLSCILLTDLVTASEPSELLMAFRAKWTFLKIGFFYWVLEREEGGGDITLLLHPPMHSLVAPCMCPDHRSKLQPWYIQDDALTKYATWPGPTWTSDGILEQWETQAQHPQAPFWVYCPYCTFLGTLVSPSQFFTLLWV